MKKIFTTLALVAFAATASAATGFTTYDYDQANAGQGSFEAQHEVHVGAAVATKFGAFDGAVVGSQLVTASRDKGLGFELGYSKGLKLGTVAVTARAAYGRVNQLAVGGGGFTGNSQYYSLSAEAALPIAKNVTGFVGYRFRDGLNSNTPAVQNRFTAGVDFAVTKGVTLRAGYAFTKQAGYNMNGLTTAVTFAF